MMFLIQLLKNSILLLRGKSTFATLLRCSGAPIMSVSGHSRTFSPVNSGSSLLRSGISNFTATHQTWTKLDQYHCTDGKYIPVEDRGSSNGEGHHDDQVGEEGKGAEDQVGPGSKPSFNHLSSVQ